MLIGFIEKTNYQFAQEGVKCERKVHQVNRYEAILKQYQSFKDEPKKTKEYEL